MGRKAKVFARHCCYAFLVVVAFVLLRAAPLHAQTAPVRLWLISYHDQNDINQLAANVDVWEVDHSTHQLLAALTQAEVDALSQTHTLTLAPDQSPLNPPQVSAAQTDGIPGYECYRTVDESFATLNQLAHDYPNLVRKLDIGDSWDKITPGGPPGDDMRVLVITNKAIPGPKFHFMLMGGIHAREYVTSELALRFAELLLHKYGSDADATWLLDHGELDLLTFANPDGRRIAETGLLWRKNTHFDASCSPSSYGVDLNRNSTFMWHSCDGCSSANSCTEVYRGAAPGSEPEVQSIEKYLRSLFPDQRGNSLDDSAPLTKSGLFLTLHSYGQLVLFPWGWTVNHAPNGIGLASIARHFGYSLNYTVCQAGANNCLYQTDGTTDDFAYGTLGVPGFTIEFGTAFFQSCSTFEDTMVQPAMDAFLYAFKVAPQAYILSQGPEVVNMLVSPQNLGSTSHVTISATADTTRMAPLSGDDSSDISVPTEPIQGARLTVDQLPWEPAPVSYPVAAVDGSFDSPTETISTTLETACFPTGRHNLYLQAQDSGGDWGVTSAGFVTVTNDSPFVATISTPQMSARDNQPITYTVRLTNTSATTATYTAETILASDVKITPSSPMTVAGGKSAQLTVAITPHNSAAGTVVPAVVIIRSAIDPSKCRQVQMATPIATTAFQTRLVDIRKP